MGNFADEQHALVAGVLWGTLVKAGIRAVPELDDEDNYLPILVIRLPEGPGVDQEVRVLVLADDSTPPVRKCPPIYDALGQRVNVR